MATISALGTAVFNTTSGTHSVTATPAVGDLIVILTANTGSVASVAPTDNNDGGTYTLVNSCLKASSADLMSMWVRNSFVEKANSTVFQQAPGATSGGGISVFKITGMKRVGLNAIRQSAIQSNQAAAGTPTPVLGGAALTTNPLLGGVHNATSPATMTPRASWTEVDDVGYSTPTTGFESMLISSGETASSIAWGGTSASAFSSIVAEFDVSTPITQEEPGDYWWTQPQAHYGFVSKRNAAATAFAAGICFGLQQQTEDIVPPAPSGQFTQGSAAPPNQLVDIQNMQIRWYQTDELPTTPTFVPPDDADVKLGMLFSPNTVLIYAVDDEIVPQGSPPPAIVDDDSWAGLQAPIAAKQNNTIWQEQDEFNAHVVAEEDPPLLLSQVLPMVAPQFLLPLAQPQDEIELLGVDEETWVQPTTTTITPTRTPPWTDDEIVPQPTFAYFEDEWTQPAPAVVNPIGFVPIHQDEVECIGIEEETWAQPLPPLVPFAPLAAQHQDEIERIGIEEDFWAPPLPYPPTVNYLVPQHQDDVSVTPLPVEDEPYKPQVTSFIVPSVAMVLQQDELPPLVQPSIHLDEETWVQSVINIKTLVYVPQEQDEVERIGIDEETWWVPPLFKQPSLAQLISQLWQPEEYSSFALADDEGAWVPPNPAVVRPSMYVAPDSDFVPQAIALDEDYWQQPQVMPAVVARMPIWDDGDRITPPPPLVEDEGLPLQFPPIAPPVVFLWLQQDEIATGILPFISQLPDTVMIHYEPNFRVTRVLEFIRVTGEEPIRVRRIK